MSLNVTTFGVVKMICQPAHFNATEGKDGIGSTIKSAFIDDGEIDGDDEQERQMKRQMPARCS